MQRVATPFIRDSWISGREEQGQPKADCPHIRLTVKIDKAAILRAYKSDGEIVRGADIVKGEPPLTIR